MGNVKMPNLVGYAAKKTTTQTRAALPLPSVSVSEKEPTLLERIRKTLTAAGKGTLGDSVNILGTLQDIDTRYREAKERMGDKSGTVSLGKEGYSVKLGGSKESDEKAKAIQTAADRLKESSAEDAERAKQGLGGVGRFAVDLGVAGAQMAGDIALGTLGGTGALAPMAARVFGGSTQEARQSGASLGQQLAYGAGSAALSVATEQIANTSKLMQRVFGKSTLASAIAKKFGDKGVTKAITEAVNKMQQTAVGRAAINAISEGGEEFIEDIFQPMLQRATYDKDAKFDLAGAIYDAAVGGALGVIGGAGERKALPLPGGTEAQGATQSEFERIRLKTAEEEAAQRSEKPEIALSENDKKTDLRHVIVKLKENATNMQSDRSVASLTGSEFEKGSKKLTEQVGDFFRSLGNKVLRKGFGTVIVDERGVKDDIAHGIGRAKAATFAAVPSVIENGRQIDFQENWKGRGYDSYIFAAPVDMNGKRSYVAAVVRSGEKNRFYLHEVVDGDGNLIYIKKENAPAAIKTGVTVQDGVTGTAETSSASSMPENGGNVNSYNAVMPRGDEEINTEANRRSEQSEFERIRLKTAEEETRERGLSSDEATARNTSGWSEELRGTVNALGHKLGVRVVVDDSIGGIANGYYDAKTNEIHLAADAQNPALQVLRHETTHRMQQLSPKEYRVFRDYAVRMAGEDAVTFKQAEYERGGKTLTNEEAMDEIAAETAEKLLTDETAISDFIRENRTAAQKFYDALRSIVQKVKEALGGDQTLAQAERLWKSAFEKADAQAQENAGSKSADVTENGEKRFSVKNGWDYLGFQERAGELQKEVDKVVSSSTTSRAAVQHEQNLFNAIRNADRSVSEEIDRVNEGAEDGDIRALMSIRRQLRMAQRKLTQRENGGKRFSLKADSEFERIRLKTAEEEAAEREANKPVEMTNTDYEQQRRDLDEYWEMVGKQATMTREAPEKADTADLVTAEATKEKKNFKESVKDLGATLRRKWIDSADAVSEIGKATGDKALYPYFNMARASSNAALNMITTAQTNVKGETVGKSLNDIFGPIRAKGNDYYNLFQTYLFHRHNVDRMSRYSQENVDKAAAAMQEFKTNNPELLMYEQYQLEQMAQDEWSDYNVEAKEYLRLLRELRKAENTKNKPVFGFGWDAEESKAEADKLLREHPEFETLAEDVYAYARNLMQYRVDSGLITEEQRKYIEQIYPRYVPTFRVTEKTPLQMDEKAVQIGSTIKQAKGGDQKLIPLHKALADQTMSVVREGSKNRFGQRLLSAERSKAAKEHLRHVEETENGFSADAFDDTKDDFDKITNTFTVRSNGKRYDITVSPDLYEGIKALTPEQLSDNRFLKGARRANDLFKKLCTSMSPTFMIRNPIKDLQDAGLYSKNAGAFAVQFPQAVKEISANGEYWQRYKALGGTYTSFFDYETGDMEKRSKLAEKTVGRIETLNNAIEQAPRLAEFMATVKKAGGLENASTDTLMQAMHNAADVTVNFGRSGTIARTVNRYVPFFNAGMQGLSKNVRLFTETKGAKDWTKLVTKCIILGVAPRLINEMAFGDRDDWDDIKDEAKDQNYLFPIGENKWLKIPKGRALSTFGLLGNAAATAMSGEEIDARYILDTAADNLAPANPLKNNIFAAAMDSDLFDPSSPGTTWYGGGIESQRLQNYAPAERYDAKTDELSKWLGKTLGLSPKKINYILDQYTGFAGDVILPMLTTAAETSPFVNAFVVDSTTNNKLSGDFYDKLDELTFAKNGKGATGADAVAYRWFNKQSSAVSEINAAIREIEADATLSGEEKKDLLEAQYKIRNAAEKSALDMLERYADAAKFYYDAAAGDEDDRVDDAYLRANREVFGAAYALQTYNKQVYEKAVEVNAEGVDFDDYFDFYFATRGIEADKDANGKSISGSKKEKVLAAIDAMDITDEQKDALYLLQGYSEKTINEAPWNGGKALELPKLELPKIATPVLELPKLELPALELPR